MMSLSTNKDAEVIEAFNSTYLVNINITYFDGMIKQIYPSEFN